MKNVAGPMIKRLRTSNSPRMTQADLASALQLEGMSLDRAGVAKMEGGLRRISDVELVLIARIFGVAPCKLLSGDAYSERKQKAG